MRRLIITADDFGLTSGVNRGIRDAHESGALTATTVLANGGAADEAAQLQRDCPALDVGLHVNLTLGVPCADPATVRSLVDDEGRFHRLDTFFRLAVRGALHASELYREVEAQVVRLRELGVTPTHWDAHQQAAFGPRVISAVATALHSAGIDRVRSPRALPRGAGAGVARSRWRWRLQRPQRLLSDLHREWAHRWALRQFLSPDWQLAPSMVDGALDYVGAWERLFATVPRGVSEIVSHPAHLDREIARLTPGLVDEREVDRSVLCRRSLPADLRNAGIELIGFRQLD